MAKPEITFRQGNCQASVFVNEVVRNGRGFEMKSVSFQRRYKDKDGEWKSTSKLDVNDIPKAILCLTKAFDYMTASDNTEKIQAERVS